MQLDVYGVLTTDDLSVRGAVPLDRAILGVVARFLYHPRIPNMPALSSSPSTGPVT